MKICETEYTNIIRNGAGRYGGDIKEHLPVIKKYADECNYCIEMGVRNAITTWAFLVSECKALTSIDLKPPPNNRLELVRKGAKEKNIDFKFIEADTTKIKINPCDLLFIDTLHTYDQLSQELYLHGNKVSKYLIFHDTSNEFGPELNRAINEFLSKNKHWGILEVLDNNNGLTVLSRS